MAKRVWFELVDATDPHSSLTTETSLRLTSDISIIDDLRATIHSQYHHSEGLLEKCGPGEVRIFPDRDAYLTGKDPLKPRDSVDSLDLDKVLIVERPQRQKRLKVEKLQGLENVNAQAASGTAAVPSQILQVPGEKQGKTAEGSEIFAFDDLATLTTLGQKLNRETDLVAGEILVMPKSVFGTVFPNGLYIREEYWAVYKVIQEEMKSKEMLSRILVIGSPGIGKSVFGIFLLLVLMTERKDVAYRPLGQEPFFFSWDGVNSHYEISRLPLAGKKYEGLFDGNESGDALTLSDFRHTFVFASPRDKNFNQFVKDLCVKVYMNPWTKDECQALADAIWKTRGSTDSSLQNEDEWFHRFNLVGGKPRLLFASFEEYDDLVKCVEGAIPQNVDVLETQVRQFQLQIFDKSMKHILFLMYRDETKSSRSYLTFASSIVERMISSHYTVESAERIISLLQTPASNLQSWRGKELEKYLLKQLPTSKFCMRSLEANNEGTEELLGPFMAASEYIHAASEIQNKLALYRPMSKTFPAIDAVFVAPSESRVLYVQSTVAKRHSIKYQALKDVYEELTGRAEFHDYTHCFLFIVSAEVYDRFTAQPYQNKDGKKRKMKIDIDITQYVGKIIRE